MLAPIRADAEWQRSDRAQRASTQLESPVAREEIDLRSDLRNLSWTRAFVRRICRRSAGAPMGDGQVAALELAVNEAASNIIKHAYQGRGDQWIRLQGEVFADHVIVRLLDWGAPSNLQAIRAPLDGPRESGLGLHLIEKSADEVHCYQDEYGRNCILLKKARVSLREERRS
jgi:serine/threonine-protein kinase RsbW